MAKKRPPAKPKAAKRPKGAKTARSQRELGRALGKSQPAVHKWLKDDRWPFGKKGPWDVHAVRDWVARTLAPNPAATAEDESANAEDLSDLPLGRRVDVGLKISRKETLDFKLAVARGEYHRVDECRNHRLRQIHEVKTAFLNMADGLPIDSDSKLIVKGRVLEILRMFSAPPQTAAAIPDAAGHTSDPSAVV